MKNIDKFQAIVAEIGAIEARLLANFLEGKTVPTALYKNAGNAGVEEWPVVGVHCSHETLWDDKRPSNSTLVDFQKKLDAMRVRTEADPMKVFIDLKQTRGTGYVSANVPWARLVDGSYGYYQDRATAEAVNKKWHEDHDPKPGHFACDYCRKQTPEANRVQRTIFVNRGQQLRSFCTPRCASYDQFASEG